MFMVSVPEELKNAVCCLKCRKVNVEHSSETAQNNKILRRCSVCHSYCYIYNEFNSGISILLKMGLYILFPTAVGLSFMGAPLKFNFWWNFSVTILSYYWFISKVVKRELWQNYSRSSSPRRFLRNGFNPSVYAEFRLFNSGFIIPRS